MPLEQPKDHIPVEDDSLNDLPPPVWLISFVAIAALCIAAAPFLLLFWSWI